MEIKNKLTVIKGRRVGNKRERRGKEGWSKTHGQR